MLRLLIALGLVGAAVCGPPVSRSRSDIEAFRDFLESTRTKRGVVLGRNPNGKVWQNSGKYQGDILLDEEQVESMVKQYAQGRNAYIWPDTLWPNRTVVYEFAPGVFNVAQQQHILRTIRVIEAHTCVRFRRRNPGEFNYVLITGDEGDGCYANVGYWPDRGVHTLNLEVDEPGRGCFIPTVIVHEWLHIIGFFHMQSTYNRNWYVRINWWNVERGWEHNFERFGWDETSNLGLPYEYDSTMHYDAYAFSINGRPTITALRPHTGVMGQLDYVTSLDFLRVDRHYGCVDWRKDADYKPFFNHDINQYEAEPVAAEEAPKNE